MMAKDAEGQTPSIGEKGSAISLRFYPPYIRFGRVRTFFQPKPLRIPNKNKAM